MSPHERRFHHDVDALVARVEEMARLSRKSVLDGVEAFKELDTAKAQEVIDLNGRINHIDVEIEARALDLLALHQPMAVDLRTIGACLKIITYLDRIGRYGYDIAKATLDCQGRAHVKRLVSIPHMANLAVQLLDNAVAAFGKRDVALARSVQPDDDAVDALYDQILRECVTYMIEDPRHIPMCTNYILVARHLERVGDNAGKIAEKAIYRATGERRLDTPQV